MSPQITVRAFEHEGIHIVPPTRPDFDELARPLIGRVADIGLRLKPMLAIVVNNSQQTVVSYSKTWTVRYASGRASTIRSHTSFPEAICGDVLIAHDPEALPPGAKRIEGANLVIQGYAQTEPYYDQFLEQFIVEKDRIMANAEELSIELEAVIFADGTLVGTDPDGWLRDLFAECVAQKQAWYRQILSRLSAGASVEEAYAPVREFQQEGIANMRTRQPFGDRDLHRWKTQAAADAQRWRREVNDDELPELLKRSIRLEPFEIRPKYLPFAVQGFSTGGRITGSVTDAMSAAPVSGAQVTLTIVRDVPGRTFGRRPRQSSTDANGVFAFDGVEGARYTLNVEKSGFASYPDLFGDGPADRLTVDADHKDVQLRIVLKRGAVIAGRILNSAGAPEANLQVAALKRTDRVGPIGFAQVGDARTNDLGEFRIAGLPSGEYRIVAATQQQGGPFEAIQTGATTLAPTFFPGTLDQNAARSVVLLPGQAVTGIEFAITAVAAFRVSGLVVDQSGQPSPRAMVILIPNIGTSAHFMPNMAFAKDDGTFEIGQVIPGTYQLRADVNQGSWGLGSVSFEVASDGTPSGSDTVTVDSADITGLKVIVSAR